MFDVTRSAPLAAKLGKVLAPALAELEYMRGIDTGSSKLEVMAALAPALKAGFEGLAAAGDFNLLAGEILAGTSVVADGSKIDLAKPGGITLAFGGDLVAYMTTLWFALEVNFKRFTSAALDGFGVGGQGDVSTSPPASR